MKKIRNLPPDRISVLNKINQYESQGGEAFFLDVEDDPPHGTLMPEDVDYLHETLKFKINGFFSRRAEEICKKYCKIKYRITVSGEENLAMLKGGAIFTSNHFAVTENLAVKLAGEKASGHHRMYKLVREGNYFMPGIIGWLLKYCDTLPLSSSLSTMKLLDKSIAKILQNGDFILMYPEQSMWWNYKKPRPYKIGAYYYAAKNSVPVVPCFVTLHPKINGRELLPKNIKYSIHILPPIFPNKNLKPKENAGLMLRENERLCREIYEQVYKEKLKYGL